MGPFPRTPTRGGGGCARGPRTRVTHGAYGGGGGHGWRGHEASHEGLHEFSHQGSGWGEGGGTWGRRKVTGWGWGGVAPGSRQGHTCHPTPTTPLWPPAIGGPPCKPRPLRCKPRLPSVQAPPPFSPSPAPSSASPGDKCGREAAAPPGGALPPPPPPPFVIGTEDSQWERWKIPEARGGPHQWAARAGSRDQPARGGGPCRWLPAGRRGWREAGTAFPVDQWRSGATAGGQWKCARGRAGGAGGQ